MVGWKPMYGDVWRYMVGVCYHWWLSVPGYLCVLLTSGDALMYIPVPVLLMCFLLY